MENPDQIGCSCSCTSLSANLALVRKELERYKAMYEKEREQFDEFQRYSKELENEMELELKQRDQKLIESESTKRRLTAELDNLKFKMEHQREENIQLEEHYRKHLTIAEQQCSELRQKLRQVEQANDDLERSERIHSQQLLDLGERYDKCLERCAFLEAGMLITTQNHEFMDNIVNGTITDSGMGSGGDIATNTDTSSPVYNQQKTHQMITPHKSQMIIENMLRKIETVETKLSLSSSPINEHSYRNDNQHDAHKHHILNVLVDQSNGIDDRHGEEGRQN